MLDGERTEESDAADHLRRFSWAMPWASRCFQHAASHAHALTAALKDATDPAHLETAMAEWSATGETEPTDLMDRLQDASAPIVNIDFLQIFQNATDFVLLSQQEETAEI